MMATPSQAAAAGAMSTLSLRTTERKQECKKKPKRHADGITLLALPAELLDLILEMLSRDVATRQRSLLALCRTCKKLQSASKPFLYSTLPQGGSKHRLPLLIEALFAKPASIQYLRNIVLSQPDFKFSCTTPSNNRIRNLLKSVLPDREQRPDFLSIARVAQALNGGKSTTVLAILCCLCPKLCALTLEDQLHCTSDALTINDAFNFSVMRQQNLGQNAIFSNLSSFSVRWRYGAEPNWVELACDAISSAFDLPSMRKLQINCHGSEFRPSAAFSAIKDHASSKINELDLSGAIDPNSRSLLLRRCESVASLKINAKYLKDFVNDLMHHKSSLKHLSVRSGERYDWSGLGSALCNLPTLKTLVVDESLIADAPPFDFLDAEAPEVTPWRAARLEAIDLQALPTTLTSLTLYTESHPQMVFQILDDLLSSQTLVLSLEYLQLDFQLLSDECNTPYVHVRLADQLDFSTDCLDIKAKVGARGDEGHFIVTIRIKKFRQLAIELRENHLQRHIRSFCDELPIDCVRPITVPPISLPVRRLFERMTLAKDILQLCDELHMFRTLIFKETQEEWKRRHGK